MYIGVDLVQLKNGEYRTGEAFLSGDRKPSHRNGGQGVSECRCGSCPPIDPVNSNIQLFFKDERSMEQHLKRANLRVPAMNVADMILESLKHGIEVVR